MRLTVLTENTAGGKFLAEHGLSYLIEVDGTGILFDSGHSDVYLRNALSMGIDLSEKVDLCVLSHGHWDHGDGFPSFPGKGLPLITHPAAFMKRYRKADHSPVGLSYSREDLESSFTLRVSAEALQISGNSYYLGEIPRNNNFESLATSFINEQGEEDFVPDDSAIAVKLEGSIAVITGCSHAGICNIVEHARKVTGVEKVDTVIGGFHLKHRNEQTLQTIEYFRAIGVKRLYPSHCTELPALAEFHTAFGISQVKTGMLFEF